MDTNSFIYFNIARMIMAVLRAIKIFSSFTSVYGGWLKYNTFVYDTISFI